MERFNSPHRLRSDAAVKVRKMKLRSTDSNTLKLVRAGTIATAAPSVVLACFVHVKPRRSILMTTATVRKTSFAILCLPSLKNSVLTEIPSKQLQHP